MWRAILAAGPRRLGRTAKKFMDEVVAECEMSEVARKAAASKITRAIRMQLMHKRAYTNDGHFGSRAEERGAVCCGFFECRCVRAGGGVVVV